MSLYTSILTAGTNSHQETSENANAVATDFVSAGVVGSKTNTSGVAPTTGTFGVNAQGTPNMTVAVNSGIAWVACTPTSQNSQMLRVRNTATANVTISANTSGSTKYDFIYISTDPAKAANPAVDASDVATLVVSRSSSSTTDNGTPPAYGLNIAIVTVSNGASSIINGNIADKRSHARTLSGASSPNTTQTIAGSSTSSTGFGNLADNITTSVDVTVGNNGSLLVLLSAEMYMNEGPTTTTGYVSFSLSGANTLAASISNAIATKNVTSSVSSDNDYGTHRLLTGLTPGVTTVTLKYGCSGTANLFSVGNRTITAIPY